MRWDVNSWEVRLQEAAPLVLALHVRDSAGLHRWLDRPIPPLYPAGHNRVIRSGSSAASEWQVWWEALVQRNIEYVGPEDMLADLKSAVPSIRDPGIRIHWAFRWLHTQQHDAQPKRGGALQALVADLECQLGRRTRPFKLDVSILPVSGPPRVWPASRTHVLMSYATLEDLSLLRPALRQLV